MLHDPQSDAARRRDLAVICGDREPVGGLDATIAACDALTVIGRARLLYLRETHRGSDGEPWIRADLDSDLATRGVDPKFLR